MPKDINSTFEILYTHMKLCLQKHSVAQISYISLHKGVTLYFDGRLLIFC